MREAHVSDTRTHPPDSILPSHEKNTVPSLVDKSKLGIEAHALSIINHIRWHLCRGVFVDWLSSRGTIVPNEYPPKRRGYAGVGKAVRELALA